MINALTIDVEDYHNVIARDWLRREMKPTRTIVENTNRLLDLFATEACAAPSLSWAKRRDLP